MKSILKKFIFLVGIIFFANCSKIENIEQSNISVIETSLGVNTSDSPLGKDFLFFKDVPYGNKDRNFLDIILPKTNKLNGAVIFFHGGSFLFGSKEDLYLSLIHI